MKSSLRRKLLYSYIAVTVLILAGVSVAISVLLREYFGEQTAGTRQQGV